MLHATSRVMRNGRDATVRPGNHSALIDTLKRPLSGVCLKGPTFDWAAVRGNGNVEVSAGRRFAASSGRHPGDRRAPPSPPASSPRRRPPPGGSSLIAAGLGRRQALFGPLRDHRPFLLRQRGKQVQHERVHVRSSSVTMNGTLSAISPEMK